jgi:hypothetical protein
MVYRLLAVLTSGMALVLAGKAAAQAPSGDSVTGHAVSCDAPVCLPDDPFARPITIDVDARSGPSGENPSGTVGWTEGRDETSISYNLNVTCLVVHGREATIGGTGTLGVFHQALQIAGLVHIVDGGGPAAGQDLFELRTVDIREVFEPPPPPPDCSSFTSSPDAARNDQGDLVVRDTEPLPSSKEQCKNGGWRNYGSSFKNQGECIAFVQRGPKP